MKLPFGWTLSRGAAPEQKALQSVESGRAWLPLTFVNESFAGAWQMNQTLAVEDSFSYWAVLRCINIIASDIAKMELCLKQETEDGVFEDVTSPAFSPVLRKPNHYQNRVQFIQSWMESKLTRGNTYVLKQRDNRDVVTALYVLDPWRVKPLVSDSDGAVFYELQQDHLSQLETQIAVPASEIIHDRWNTIYHPLIGLSPIYAAGITAQMGKKIQANTEQFFTNASMPSGMLVAPERISNEQAQKLKHEWEEGYAGLKIGKIAVMGGGLEFKPIRMTSTDAQMIETLKWTDSTIAGAFGIPAYMINAGTVPAGYSNVEALTILYYASALQIHVESIEACLNEGLGLYEAGYSTEFELDDLLRMDTSSLVSTLQNAVKGILTADEARAKLGYGRKPGGNKVLTQQQNVSIEAAAEQSIKPPQPAPQPQADNENEAQDSIDGEQAARALLAITKGLQHVTH
jgi:HK97 family phage portal protein